MPDLDDAARPGRRPRACSARRCARSSSWPNAGRRRRRSSTSSSRSAARSSAAGLVPIIEPEVDIHSPREGRGRGAAEGGDPRGSSTRSAGDQQVMLKLTLPDERRLLRRPRRPPERACGSSRCPAATPATTPTTAWPATTGVIASFSRALTEGLSRPADRRRVRRRARRVDQGASTRRRSPERLAAGPRPAVRSIAALSVATARRTVTGGWAHLSDTVERDSAPHATERLDRVIIRFAGDSGDGMQLTGDRFTSASAMFGNDLATLPDFPAEIRAPGRHAGRRVGLPGAHLGPRDHHARRRAQRAGGDEPGRAAQRAASGSSRAAR